MLKQRSAHRTFGGITSYWEHESSACNSPMRFSVFEPPTRKQLRPPVLYYLAGLTCTEETFMVKAGAQRFAAAYGIMLVTPDTSPRNTGIPNEDQDWDLGSGAGFYIDAQQKPWVQHYRMYSYVTSELPTLIASKWDIDPHRRGIFGHSMGGHGALVCALKKPEQYLSVSAFAPIAAPTQCPWGKKAFACYLGTDADVWKEWDASEIVGTTKANYDDILIDQGTKDEFLSEQLFPERFLESCRAANQSVTFRKHDGYDHGYNFISTFIADHMEFHGQRLVEAELPVLG